MYDKRRAPDSSSDKLGISRLTLGLSADYLTDLRPTSPPQPQAISCSDSLREVLCASISRLGSHSLYEDFDDPVRLLERAHQDPRALEHPDGSVVGSVQGKDPCVPPRRASRSRSTGRPGNPQYRMASADAERACSPSEE